MEHFPPILKPYQPIEIPFRGGRWAPGDDVACSDLNLAGSDARAASSAEEREIRRSLQARLFFGLLHGVLQIDIAPSEFIATGTDGKTKILTTRELRRYLGKWKAEHDALRMKRHWGEHAAEVLSGDETENTAAVSKQLLDERRLKAEKCLNDAYGAWRDVKPGHGQGDDEVWLKVELSIQLLGIALEHAIQSVSAYCDICAFEPWVGGFSVPWRRDKSNAFLTDRLTTQGWCPSVVEALRKQGGLSVMYYTSVLGPPVRKGHAEAGCVATETGCRKVNISNFPYKPLHTKDCQGCQFLGPDAAGMKKMCDMIEDGGIPILYLDEGRIMVERQRRGLEYTAISHVWADGLGNPDGNELPACQINGMIKHIRQLQWTASLKTDEEKYDDRVWKIVEPVEAGKSYSDDEMGKRLYFWIDTICVPQSSEDIIRKAITQMRAVYGRANRVLVLDADLLATHVVPLTKPYEKRPDVHVKITASTWQKRYWTLQEGALARRLWFQFANGAYEKGVWAEFITQEERREEAENRARNPPERSGAPSVDPPRRKKRTISNVEYYFDDEVCYYCDQTEYAWRTSNSFLNPTARVTTVWRALESRACSYASDKPLCHAILLDMDTVAIQRARELVDAVRILWEMFTVIPAGLLCLPAQKHRERHLRWAPVNLDVLSKLPNSVRHPAHIGREGIIEVRLQGFTARKPPGLRPRSVIPVVLGGELYYIRNNVQMGNEPWTETTVDGGVRWNVDFDVVTEVGVILGQEPLGDGEAVPAFEGALGALVSVVRREVKEEGGGEGVLVVRYLGAVSVIRRGSVFDRFPSRAWTEGEEGEKEGGGLEGEGVVGGREWMIVCE